MALRLAAAALALGSAGSRAASSAACSGGACLAMDVDAPGASLLQRRAARGAPREAWLRALRDLVAERGGREPRPLRPEDWELLERLASEEGPALRAAAWRDMAKVPEGWAGPKRLPGELWGGPSREFAEADFEIRWMPSAHPEQRMNFAGPGSGIPAPLWGIWWMDQNGSSSVAKDPSYPFKMNWTPEVLASFGPVAGDGTFTWGAHYEEETRCVTPVPLYGGPQWAGVGGKAGGKVFEAHGKCKNTISFCFTDDTHEVIQLYQKMLLENSAIGPIDVGPVAADMLGFMDAGDGYGWVPHSVLNMTMVRKPWGWDRVTTFMDGFSELSAMTEWFLWSTLPSALWDLIKVAQDLQHGIESHYPLLQVVDGQGQKTAFFQEFLAHLRVAPGQADRLSYAMPKTGDSSR